MNHLHVTDARTHSYYDGAVQIQEFNFSGNATINDAEITLTTRYPAEGYAVNDISTALISVESGEGSITTGDEVRPLVVGDRVLVQPGEPYYIQVMGELVIRYIASPAWTAEQARIIEA